MKVAILASDNMMPGAHDEREDGFERDEQMGKLVPALAALGAGCELRRWRDVEAIADEYNAVLPLFCWDYWESREEFLSAMDKAGERTRVINAPSLLRWNTDKAYLADLGEKGAPIIETVTVEHVDAEVVAQAYETLGAERIVIKPQVGAGAWRQVSLRRGEAIPAPEEMPPGTTMIQPFLNAVEVEGEISMLHFGGRFSHALRKTPKAGDYRIQSLYGGREEVYVPDAAMIALAADVLAMMHEVPLYARVDLLRGNDGEWCLIEVEMVEPYLYLGLSAGDGGENAGAQAFARALVDVLNQA